MILGNSSNGFLDYSTDSASSSGSLNTSLDTAEYSFDHTSVSGSVDKEVKDEATEETSAGGINIKEEIIDEDESRNATVYSTVLIHVPEAIKEEIKQESMDTEDPLL